jgi:hypothetical protein
MNPTPEQLQKIIADHKKWLNDEPDGSCANLSGANLSGANLIMANLSWANLSGADLRRANLDARHQPVLQISGSMHPITMMGSGNIRIGCKVGTLQWWQENNVSLGKENSYSDGQIEEYAKYIELLAWRVEQHNKTTAITENPSVV